MVRKVNGIPKAQFFKTIAFQMGQTLALMDGCSVMAKETIGDRFPELVPYLFREADADTQNLQRVWDKFVERVSARSCPPWSAAGNKAFMRRNTILK